MKEEIFAQKQKKKKGGGNSVIRIQVNHRLKFLITFSPKKETI